jgi:lysozyme family protein
MTHTFARALAHVMEWEGGYVNDPNDPGGETKFGISKRAYPALDIANLRLDEAEDIYRRDYWDRIRGDELSPGLALAMFDCAVNQGLGTAVKLLQRALGVAADGIIGPVTLAAVRRDPEKAFVEFMAERMQRYAVTGGVKSFSRGWFRRLSDTYRACMHLQREETDHAQRL